MSKEVSAPPLGSVLKVPDETCVDVTNRRLMCGCFAVHSAPQRTETLCEKLNLKLNNLEVSPFTLCLL